MTLDTKIRHLNASIQKIQCDGWSKKDIFKKLALENMSYPMFITCLKLRTLYDRLNKIEAGLKEQFKVELER